MQTRVLGQSGIEASTVAFGAWAIGGWLWGGTDGAEAVRAIQTSIDSGVTLIDTAPAYGLGLSEELVGRAIQGRRDQVVLATKCGLVWHTDRGTFFFNQAGKPVHKYLGRNSVIYECEQSLRRLGTDHIDLYQTHWQDTTTPIEETMGALLDLKREGKIRAIGVSNITLPQLNKYLDAGPVDTAQERYSLLDRGLEATVLPFCLNHQIAVLAYSPLANGLLTGRIGPDRAFPQDDLRANNLRFTVQNRQRIADRLDQIRPIAERYGITLAQLVVAWTLARPWITHALVGARNEAQARENAAAGDVLLTAEEMSAITEAFRPPVTV